MDINNDLQVTVGQTREKNKLPEPINAIVPVNQAWLYYTMTEQTRLLEGINNKLGFMVVVIIIGILIGLFRGCAGF